MPKIGRGRDGDGGVCVGGNWGDVKKGEKGRRKPWIEQELQNRKR
jgi:hypothetical protein